jgi:hypothetical protein
MTTRRNMIAKQANVVTRRKVTTRSPLSTRSTAIIKSATTAPAPAPAQVIPTVVTMVNVVGDIKILTDMADAATEDAVKEDTEDVVKEDTEDVVKEDTEDVVKEDMVGTEGMVMEDIKIAIMKPILHHSMHYRKSYFIAFQMK